MRTIARVLLTLVLAVAACAGGYELWNYYLFSPWTRDARVQADVVSIAPDVAGYVDDLRVKDNQFVHKGDILMLIDQARYIRALATADATVAARKADMDNAEQQAARRAKLTQIAISDDARETAILAAATAAATYQQAVAGRSTAQLNLDRTVVRAPVNGFVTNLTLDIGQYASVGTKVMALIDSDSYRVTGYFEETKVPVIKPGEEADIYLLNGAPPLRGHVQSIARGITDRDKSRRSRTPGQCESDIRVGSARPAHSGAYSHRSCTYGGARQLGHDLYRCGGGAAPPMGDSRGAAQMASRSAMTPTIEGYREEPLPP
jgi:multidrug resistance efflux pump